MTLQVEFFKKRVCWNLERTNTFLQSIYVAMNWNLLTGRASGYFSNFISPVHHTYFTTIANFSFLPSYQLLQLDINDLVFNGSVLFWVFVCLVGFLRRKKNKSNLVSINSGKGDSQSSLTFNIHIVCYFTHLNPHHSSIIAASRK